MDEFHPVERHWMAPSSLGSLENGVEPSPSRPSDLRREGSSHDQDERWEHQDLGAWECGRACGRGDVARARQERKARCAAAALLGQQGGAALTA